MRHTRSASGWSSGVCSSDLWRSAIVWPTASSKTPLFRVLGEAVGQTIADLHRARGVRAIFEDRSEERRVGKEGTSWWLLRLERKIRRTPLDRRALREWVAAT